MMNDDLIAFLQPAPNRFDSNAWRDVTMTITAIDVQPHRLAFRLRVPAGLYRGLIRTRDHAFDMSTADVEMTEVPTGRKVPVGPWDLDHLHNVMAMPTARVWVNGRLTGGLWFTEPGPADIAAGRLTADFGFEAESDETEVVMEFVERDRTRLSWRDMESIELREDDRRPLPLEPAVAGHPRIYLTANELPALRERLANDPRVKAILDNAPPRDRELRYPFDVQNLPTQPRHFATDALVALLTQDEDMVGRVVDAVADLCARSTWTGRPDPLLMGGENDRGIGIKLYACGLAWDYLRDAFTESQRRTILAKVDEYLRKIYDFTVLQRSYMGYPSSNAHSTGTWNGVGIACMAFYEDLPIARQALPFFHGLFTDGLKTLSPDGKSKSTTLTPWHLVRYLAAAKTFGGDPPELQQSEYFDNLAGAMMSSFRTPSSQDLQRGRRTIYYRYLTAYLHRFHPVADIEAIYHAFVEEERRAAGDVETQHFDLLYAPAKVAPAPFPNEPYFARDIGQVFIVSSGSPAIGVNISAGLTGGARASFRTVGHDRAYPLSYAGIELTQDGRPVIVNVGHSNYGINSALTNAMCFEDGGLFVQGQYLPGEVGQERSASIRRFYRGKRFIYVHALVAALVDPKLAVRQAERLMVMDLHTGSLVINDMFVGDRALRYGTHLHVSGRVTPVHRWQHRLTGGQANLIAGIKGGAKDLTNDEHSEIYVTALNPSDAASIALSEAAWVPPYIYGINDGKNDDPARAKYPHYQRWRFQYDQPVDQASLCYALATAPDLVRSDGDAIQLGDDVTIHLAPQGDVAVGALQATAEAVLHDAAGGEVVLLGATHVREGDRRVTFAEPVDIEWHNDEVRCFAPHPVAAIEATGVGLGAWREVSTVNPRSHGDFQAALELTARV